MILSSRTILVSLLILMCAILLSACSSTTATIVHVNTQSATYLNPDIDGRASPVVITVYQLKSPYDFKQASYAQLSNNSEKTLGNALLDKTTFEVPPQFHLTKDITLAPETRYLGIVAGYRKIDQSRWKKILPVQLKDKKEVTINLSLESAGIATDKQSIQTGAFSWL